MRVGQTLVQRFRLDAQAGAGGMGRVYRALDMATGDAVAVKILHDSSPPAVARFEREAQALSGISHPGVVRYVAHGTTPDGEPFLVMEWLEGEDLAARLTRGCLTIDETITLARRLSEALGDAHGMRVVHRDIKPGNVFLVGGHIETPKILDFGIAYFGEASRVTATGAILGTPSYIAPELVRSGETVESTADVFSLGCVLFECLTGKPPFHGANFVAVLAKVVFEEAPRVSESVAVSAWLDELLARMLSKDRDLRPRDGAAVVRALEAGASLDAALEPPPSRLLGRSERRFLGIVLVGSTPGAKREEAVSDTVAAPTPDALRAAVERFGARVELFIDGTTIVLLDHASVPTDIAAQGARCALALRELGPLSPIALTTGWCELGRGLPVGEAIERAARLQAGGLDAAPRIALDETTAGLLDSRFDVVGVDGGGFALRGERAAIEAYRLLLGKPTPCVGRELDLALLEQSFSSVVGEPRAHVVVVTGPAGIGKSRLVHEFLARNRRAGQPAEILAGRGDPSRAGSTYGLLADVIGRAALVTGGEPIEVRRDRLAAFVARHLPERDLRRVTEFLGELAGIPFPDEDSLPLRAARQDPELCGEQMRLALRDLLHAICERRPALLVIEDVHWGDRASVSALEAAVRELVDEPILLVATARPEVEQLFPLLWTECGRQELRLKHLSPKASARLVRSALGDFAEQPLVDRLVTLSEGNPFFLEELVRAASEGSIDALPGTITAMVHARLQRLEPRVWRALRAASVFGEVFWRGGVMAMLDERAAEDDPLSALVAAEICVRHRESRFLGEAEYAFRHALVREGAYASLTTEDRALGHRLAGEWLEQAGEGDPLILAAHFERGGILTRAGELFVLGAEQANARRSYEEAEGFYARADVLLGGLSVSDRRSRGLARFRRGHHEAALLELDAARVQAEALADALAVVEILLDEAMVLDWTGDYRGAEERVLGAKARHVHWGSPLVDARLLLGHGRSSLRAGREQDAAEMLARAAASAASLGDEGYETHVISLLLLGFVLPGIGRLDQAAEALDEVIHACEARSDFLHLAAALSNRALVRTYRGDRAGMIADCERSIALGRELGQPRLELIAHYNLGETLYLMDELETADAHVRAALSLTERPNAGIHRAVVDLLDARVRLHRGDEVGALSLVTSIRRTQLGERAKGVEILAPSEDVLCAMIELAVVDASDEAWGALEARSSACSVGQERIEVIEARARAALRQRRRVSAARHFDRAIDLASRVPNVMGPRLRRALAEVGSLSTISSSRT